ncbi:hypothetical protein E3T24_03345 [Cryobacterium sp. TmT2-59]|uniref:hypothetical protein n=1 Tax=unclassified Cryobacterium TaxID=2649013 RepID=UPI001069997F|nr:MULTISPECIES: hypothetical protein [unclassified Cryobacterium]TFC88182.1 hypothetical protein E3T24_03345 [Cryobacterium sp. TmT2-59]TFD17154.1 hypothetical protein E3T32_14175 [Cryobacterium sp. TMT2-23]
MTGELWWVPSAVVFGGAGAIVVLLGALARRRGRTHAREDRSLADGRVRAASIALVRADDVVQATADELGFAEAQFGQNATHDFAAAHDASRRQVRDAFALQQKLDDSEPENESERRHWTEQIIVLADEATKRLTEQDRDFSSRRGLERDAPHLLDQLRRRLTRVAERVKAGEASLKRLGATYAPSALAPISGNVVRAQAALDEARLATDAAAARLDRASSEPVGDQLREAEHGLYRAGKLLDAIETGEDQLHIGFASLTRALVDADAELAEARRLRDTHEETEARTELNRVIAVSDRVVGELRHPSRLSDPAADLARLREAIDGLDVTRSEARNRQLRLENARGALIGALLAARSQIRVTRDFIAAHPGRVGSPARTRLAEAERQLSLATAEADPVAALDTARRAMTHATDADALARFDTL